MKRILYFALALGLTLAACGPMKYTMRGTTEATSDTYSCVMRQLTALDYEIESGDRGAGFVRGAKQTTGTGAFVLTGVRGYDGISATVTETEPNQPRVVRISGESYSIRRGNRDVDPQPSKAVVADVDAILAACKIMNAVRSEATK